MVLIAVEGVGFDVPVVVVVVVVKGNRCSRFWMWQVVAVVRVRIIHGVSGCDEVRRLCVSQGGDEK